MYDLKLGKMLTSSHCAVVVLCALAAYVGITVMNHGEIIAQDTSTSITCNGLEPCEKTECVDGNCETTATNSSNISSRTGGGGVGGSESDESGSDTHKSIADLIKERLRMRGGD